MNCYHCGLPAVPEFTFTINNEEKAFCCVGCQAVAQMIIGSGLENFYSYRDTLNQTPDSAIASFAAYDLPEVQEDFVFEYQPGINTARLFVSGITCAACAWLIENYLRDMDCVEHAAVNVASHECVISWRKDSGTLSELMSALARIGYLPQPAAANSNQAMRKKEGRTALLRLAVAGIAMMQVGMVAVALYAGEVQGITDNWRHYLRWVSLLMATPVILFSARPFFTSAVRALRLRRLNMDVPVSLALLLAYSASAWATVTNSGEVYFDSIAMFTFFLLLGRYLEMRARHSGAFETERLSQLLPVSVERAGRFENKLWREEEIALVPIKSIQPGDVVRVAAGTVVPCDGTVVEGNSSVDESILTGEAIPKPVSISGKVIAGSTNGESAIHIRVTDVGRHTQLAMVEQAVDRARQQKPAQIFLADNVAAWFVAFVLVASFVTGTVWYLIQPEKALWVVLSVLVVTCPCALSLATPAALTAGTTHMRRLGLLVLSPQFIETVNRVSHVVFDKTGTLTQGRLQIKKVIPLVNNDAQFYLCIVAALESASAHPIANAFSAVESNKKADRIKVTAGRGVEGVIEGKTYRFGQLDYALPLDSEEITYPGDGLWQLLCDQTQPLAWIQLEDALRDNLLPVLKALRENNIEISLLSGDREENVASVARELDISDYVSRALPEEKLNFIQALQTRGKTVMMIGDGINDVPVLAGADVSVAMGNSTQLAKIKSDSVLLNSDLTMLPKLIGLAKRVQNTIKQNITWAVAYNASALPLAALGFIPPYLAAVGMSLSSLVVVVNSLRLTRSSNF